jgi:hypothetical protein
MLASRVTRKKSVVLTCALRRTALWLARTHALASVLAPLLLTVLALWAALLVAWTGALLTVLARLFRSATLLRPLALFSTLAPLAALSAVAPRSLPMMIVTFAIPILAYIPILALFA